MGRTIKIPPALRERSTHLCLRSSGVVRKLTLSDATIVAIKYACTSPYKIPIFAREAAVYARLAESGADPSPFVIQSFLCTRDANFLPFYARGSLGDRLRANSEHMSDDVLTLSRILRLEPRHLVERWAVEIAAGMAWLEGLGLVHGGLDVSKVLLDDGEHVKICGLAYVVEIGRAWDSPHGCLGSFMPTRDGSASVRPDGEDDKDAHEDEQGGIEVDGSEDYNMDQNHDENECSRQRFREFGAESAQFDFGSLVYAVTRGHEPYRGPGRSWRGKPDDDEIFAMLREGAVEPPLDLEGDVLDCVIRDCWMGRFASIRELGERIHRLFPGAGEMEWKAILSRDYGETMRRDCQKLLDEGLLEWSEEKSRSSCVIQ